jgi:hypothetical protein
MAPARVLVSNDDGISAPGLRALVAALAKLGDSVEVFVCAPCEERSGQSHAISLARFLAVHPHPEVTELGAKAAYAVDGAAPHKGPGPAPTKCWNGTAAEAPVWGPGRLMLDLLPIIGSPAPPLRPRRHALGLGDARAAQPRVPGARPARRACPPGGPLRWPGRRAAAGGGGCLAPARAGTPCPPAASRAPNAFTTPAALPPPASPRA